MSVFTFMSTVLRYVSDYLLLTLTSLDVNYSEITSSMSEVNDNAMIIDPAVVILMVSFPKIINVESNEMPKTLSLLIEWPAP